MEVLFICLSNVQRSQFAEAFFNKISKKGKAISAGLFVDDSFKDLEISKISQKAVLCMSEIGYDISSKKPKQLTQGMVKEADKIIVFQRENLPDYLKNSDKVIFWDIEDPGKKDMSFRRDARDKIKKLVLDLIKKFNLKY